MFEPVTINKYLQSAKYIHKILTASQIAIPVKDVTAIQIHKSLQTYLINQNYGTIIIGGDFILHHPLWNPGGYL